MALIGKIRENSWFLIVLLVLGMGGFLFMDMIGGSRGSSLMGGQNLVGKIEGEKVYVDKFLQREQNFYGNAPGDPYQKRDDFWNFYVEETILQKASENTGIGVSPTELRDLLVGQNISPIIYQEFGQNIQQVSQFIDEYATLPPEVKNYWYELESRVIKTQLETKMNNLVSKAIYTPTWMAEEVHKGNSGTMSISYVNVPLTEASEEGIEVSDADIKKYIAENKTQFMRDEETCSIDYVTFDVSPSVVDSATIEKSIADKVKAWSESTASDSSFIVDNYGVYNTEFVFQDEMSSVIADSLFEVEPGTILGPYLESGTGAYSSFGYYRATKLVDRRVVPDSVQSRHILIPVQNPQTNPVGLANARKTVDSLKNLIEIEGAVFDTLAKYHSTDGTSELGGDLGMQGPKQFVPAFRDAIFYEADLNTLYSVVSPFGVHLVEVTGRKSTGRVGVRIATIEEIIVPSEKTQENVYNQAYQFVRDNRSLEALNKSVLENEMDKRSASDIGPNDFNIGGLGMGDASRNISKWVHKASIGDVSPEIYTYEDPVEFFNNKYVIVALTGITDEGMAGVADVRDVVEPLIINQKKAEQLAASITASDLDAIASQYSVEVQEISDLSFNGFSALNNEPAVIAEAFSLESGQNSKAIAGKSGVYVVRVNSKAEPTPANDIPTIRRQESGKMVNALNSQFGGNPLLEAMKKNAEITDNRARFF
ncbi:MAG: peptidylprolyl isomerase [Bacteroidota bacterium]